MGTISLEHSDRLYWLGRYTERFFTTIKALGRQFDKMIGTAHSYTDYLDCFGLPDTYMDNKDFIRSLLFDENNAHSAAYSLERAYDNGIVLREEISTDSLSFLQMAKDTLTKAGQSDNVRLALPPLEDIIYSFWGSINEHIYDDEIRNIIKPLRESYAGLVGLNTSGPVMGNSESVFAGLTYGKNDINENLVNNINRGMLV